MHNAGPQRQKAIETPRNPFKLSYDVNPKLPFFINALEMRENAKFGKHLVTTRNLLAGDVIAVINPHFIVLTKKAIDLVSVCYNCLKINDLDLIVTGGCKGEFVEFKSDIESGSSASKSSRSQLYYAVKHAK